MALNSLERVQKNPTIEAAKQTTQLLNCSASHPDTLTEYIIRGIIIHIYSDASYISEPEANNRAGRYFFSDQNPKHQ